MQKTYKHKKLWLVAYRISSVEYRCEMVDKIKTWYYLPAKLIENSDDWVLQEEKDWMLDIMKDLSQMSKDVEWKYFWWLEMNRIKNIIEKHMPKITKEELLNLWPNFVNTRWWTIQLLNDKWLYKE